MILLTYGQRLKVTVSLVGSQFTHKNKFRDSDCNLIPCNSYIHLSLSTASWSFQANCEIGNWQLDKLESATDASFPGGVQQPGQWNLNSPKKLKKDYKPKDKDKGKDKDKDKDMY